MKKNRAGIEALLAEIKILSTYMPTHARTNARTHACTHVRMHACMDPQTYLQMFKL